MKTRISQDEFKLFIRTILQTSDGISAQEVAEKMGMHKSYVNKVMKGMRDRGELFVSTGASGYRNFYHLTPQRVVDRVAASPKTAAVKIDRTIDIVEEYRANSPVYQFDQLQAAARARI